MNKNRIGHDDQGNGDVDENEEVHGGVVFRINSGVCFGIGAPLDCGKRNHSNGSNDKMATAPLVLLFLVLRIRGQHTGGLRILAHSGWPWSNHVKGGCSPPKLHGGKDLAFFSQSNS